MFTSHSGWVVVTFVNLWLFILCYQVNVLMCPVILWLECVFKKWSSLRLCLKGLEEVFSSYPTCMWKGTLSTFFLFWQQMAPLSHLDGFYINPLNSATHGAQLLEPSGLANIYDNSPLAEKTLAGGYNVDRRGQSRHARICASFTARRKIHPDPEYMTLRQ